MPVYIVGEKDRRKTKYLLEGDATDRAEWCWTQVDWCRKQLDGAGGSGRLCAVRTRPKIADVAKLCGVTPATVSRVLNFKANFRASYALREKIIETATKLGYAPDLAARNLNRSETRIIGLFADPLSHLAGGINQSLLDGLDEVLHVSGYDVFLDLSSSNNQRRALPFWRFDGMIG